MNFHKLLSCVPAVVFCLLQGCGTPKTLPVFSANASALSAVRTIAIVPFSDPVPQPNREFHMGRIEAVTNPGELLAGKLSEKLLSSGRFTIVERSQLVKVRGEQNLSNTDMFAPQSAAKLGQLLGARAIVVGTIQKAENFYRAGISCWHLAATIRLIDTGTAEVLMTATMNRGIEVGEQPFLEMSKIMDEECSEIVKQLIKRAGS